MRKRGKQYEESVARVMARFHPDADVSVGTMVPGPDGVREVDILIQKQSEDPPTVTLVECKDLNRPVEIGHLDALESKQRDLTPDKTVLSSNHGFSKKALKKALRVGIRPISVLNDSDSSVAPSVLTPVLGRELGVRRFRVGLEVTEAVPPAGNVPDPGQIVCLGAPLVNWINQEAWDLLHNFDSDVNVESEYRLRSEIPMELSGSNIKVSAIKLILEFRIQWLRQTVQTSIEAGLFDHSDFSLAIPANSSFGYELDNGKWGVLPSPPRFVDGKPDGYSVMVSIQDSCIPIVENAPIPKLAAYIASRIVTPRPIGVA